jgi:hypothetical protein
MLRTQVEFATWEPSLKVCLRRGEARQPGSGRGARGPNARERRSTARQARRGAGGSRAPQAQVVVELDGALRAHVVPCERAPRSAAGPRTPSLAASQPAAARKRRLPHRARSVDARGPGPLGSTRAASSVRTGTIVSRGTHRAGTRWQLRPRPCWRCPCRRSPGQRLTQRQSQNRPERARCLRPAPPHARQSAPRHRHLGTAALACRRCRPSARQAALSQAARGGTRAALEILFSADSSRSRAQGAESMVCSVWSVMLATKAMSSISLKKSARPPTYPHACFCLVNWRHGSAFGGRSSRRPAAGTTLVLTCRSPCRKSAEAHTRSALQPARGHTVISGREGYTDRENAPAGRSA